MKQAGISWRSARGKKFWKKSEKFREFGGIFKKFWSKKIKIKSYAIKRQTHAKSDKILKKS